MCAYPLVLSTRRAEVRGIYSADTGNRPFIGNIDLELSQRADEHDNEQTGFTISGGLTLQRVSLCGPLVIECRYA